jgi:hypothetical protein
MSEKKLLKCWDQDKMIRAVATVRKEQMDFKKAQKSFNVPKIPLRPYVNAKDKTPEEVLLTKLGRRSVFSADMEQEFIKYLLMKEEKYFGLRRQYVRMMAFQLAKNNNLKKSFSQLRACVGKEWFDRSLNHHIKIIPFRSATGTQ